MKTLKAWGRALAAALLIAGPAWAAQTGTAQTQSALYDSFCDQCGQPSNLAIRNFIASVPLNASAAITSGSINGTTIGATTPSTGAFTTLAASSTVSGAGFTALFASPPAIGGTAAAAATFTGITLTATTVSTGLPTKVATWGIPIIAVSSGSMGNNGALTAITALGRTYSNGAWVWYPAGAVATGVPAAASYLWSVFSSSTAATVFNSTWNGTGVPPMGTATAFVTTGPGAFTGDAVSEVGILLTVPAGAMGTNGNLKVVFHAMQTNSAGTKTYRIRHSGVSGNQYVNSAATTSTQARGTAEIWNTGMTNSQFGEGTLYNGSAGSWASTGAVTGTVDTTAATTVFVSCTRNTATDNCVIETGEVVLDQ